VPVMAPKQCMICQIVFQCYLRYPCKTQSYVVWEHPIAAIQVLKVGDLKLRVGCPTGGLLWSHDSSEVSCGNFRAGVQHVSHPAL
jgi:hypothetical protein